MAKPLVSLPMDAWVARINAAWRASAEKYIEAGKLLLECKKLAPHGDFETMLETGGLEFKPRIAQMLMAIAKSPVLTNPKNISLLPCRMTTLYDLRKMDDEALQAALDTGEIHKKTQRAEAKKVIDVEHEDITESPAATVSQAAPEDAVPAPLPAQTSAVAVTESTADDGPSTVVTTDSEGRDTKLVTNTGIAITGHRIMSGGESVFYAEPGVHTPEAVARDDATGDWHPATPEGYIRKGLALLHLGFKTLDGKAAARVYDGPFLFDEINAICDNMISFTDEFEKVESGTSVPEAAA